MSTRTDKVAKQIHMICAQALSRQSMPRGIITVNRVTVTSDLRSARVFINFLGVAAADRPSSLKAVRDYLQAEVARGLVSKYTPKISLIEDDSTRYAAEISRRINDAKT